MKSMCHGQSPYFIMRVCVLWGVFVCYRMCPCSCGSNVFALRICVLLGESVFPGVGLCALERLCVPGKGPYNMGTVCDVRILYMSW